MKALSETSADALNDPNRLLLRIGPMLTDVPDDMAAPSAFAAAQRYVHVGQWNLAREIFLMMVERYPAHPLAADSYRWLIRHNSSIEARHRHELGQFLVVEDEQHGLPIQADATLGKPGEPGADVPGIKMPAWKPGMKQAPELPEMMASQRDKQVFRKE